MRLPLSTEKRAALPRYKPVRAFRSTQWGNYPPASVASLQQTRALFPLHSAVDDQINTSDKRGLRAGEKAHRGGNIFRAADAIRGLTMSDDGKRMAIWDTNGDVFEMSLNQNAWRSLVCGVVRRELTPTEWTALVPDSELRPGCGR